MMKRKRNQDRGWSKLPWKSVEVQEGGLGEADDCFCFSIEEIDSADYMMEKDEVGGYRVVNKKGKSSTSGGGSEKKDATKGKQKGKKGQLQEEENDDDDGPVIQDIEYGDGEEGMEEDGDAEEEEPDEVSTKWQQKPIKTDSKEKQVQPSEAQKKEKAKKKKQKKDKKKPAATKEQGADEAAAVAATDKSQEKGIDMSNWSSEALGGVELHPLLLQNLQRQGFETPTEIQRLTLPLAIGKGGKDVMGAAETGSGKTLAYGLPILDYLLKERDARLSSSSSLTTTSKTTSKSPLSALVLCPTRELAMQVSSHMQEMLVGDSAQGRDRINIVSIVGGLSETKQERLLGRKPEIVVATMGRLWELVTSNEPHVRDVGRLRFFVLDEADRMVEEGHYPELNRLLKSIVEQAKSYQRDYDQIRHSLKQQQGKKKTQTPATLKKEQQQKKVKAAQVQQADEEEGEKEENEEEMPAEVPCKTLQDVMKEAKGMGLKGLHGLDEEEAEEEDEGGEKEDEEDDDIEFGEEMEVEGEEGGKEGEGEKEEEGDEEEEEQEEVQQPMEEEEEEEEDLSGRDLPPPVTRQTLIFSATLVMPEELRKQGGGKGKGKGGKKNKKGGKDDVVSRIMREVGIRGQPAIIDLSSSKGNGGDASRTATATTATPAAALTNGGNDVEATIKQPQSQKGNKAPLALPSGLELSYIKSVGGEKDMYLYYFLRRYPGRSIIFTNSIDQTRRISQLLSILRIPARALHAKMQQRQRLKSLDQFRFQKDAVLVATDVAARGLDIPLVDHVIHYDLPRSLEVFVHRSGRTARANREGLSFSLVAPRDEKMHAEVCRTLLPTESMPVFPVNIQEMTACRERVHLGGRIVGFEQDTARKQATESWFFKSARDADLELDDFVEQEVQQGNGKDRQRARQNVQDKERLTELLSKPLIVERRKFLDVASKLESSKGQGDRAMQALNSSKEKKKLKQQQQKRKA